MPSVPQAKNEIGIAETTNAKFQAADFGQAGRDIGSGLEDLGQQGARVASQWEERNAIFDEAAAKKQNTMAIAKAREILRTGENPYYAQSGFNAQGALKPSQDAINALRSTFGGELKNDRQREMFNTAFDGWVGPEFEQMSNHANGQVKVEADRQSIARADLFSDSAVDHVDDPVQFEADMATGLSEIDARAKLNGWGDDDTKFQKANYVSGIHARVASGMLKSDPPAALAYIEKNKDSITPDDELKLRDSLYEPLAEIQAELDADWVVSGDAGRPAEAPDPAAPAEVKGSRQDSIRGAAKRLGISPTELAAIASFEGGLNPKTVGGAGNNYQGIFQFGPGERRKYGIDKNSTFEEQVAALEKYAGDRGYRPGMGWKKLYTTINAGNPHAPVTAADKNGTQLEHYATIEGRHMRVAQQFLGGAYDASAYAANGAIPQKDDLAAAYARIEAQDWPFDRKQAALQAVDKRVSRNDRLISRDEDEAERSANDTIASLGENFTSINQIGSDVVRRLNPQTKRILIGMASANAKPVAIAAHGQASVLLNELADSINSDAFKAIDLRTYQGMLTPSEYSQLKRDQDKLKTKDAAALTNLRSGIHSTITFYENALDIKVSGRKTPRERELYGNISGLMRSYLERLGRTPSDDDYKAAFDNATIKVTQKGAGWLGGDVEKGRYELKGNEGKISVQVPNSERDKIVAAYKKAYGRAPTLAEVGQAYLKNGGR